MVLSSTTTWSVPSFIISIARSPALFKSILLMQSGPLLNLHCKFWRLSQEQSVGLQHEQIAEAQSTFLFTSGVPDFPSHQGIISAQPCNPEHWGDVGALLPGSESGPAEPDQRALEDTSENIEWWIVIFKKCLSYQWCGVHLYEYR